MLKGVAKKALPLAGTAVGTSLGGPLGAQIGSGLATDGGQCPRSGSRKLDQEDREFEGAKQFVRLAANCRQERGSGGARRRIRERPRRRESLRPRRRWRPDCCSRARLSRSRGVGDMAAGGHSGRWLRRGNRIVLYGV